MIIKKDEKVVGNLYDKKEYLTRNLKNIHIRIYI